jgi:hypothetical protein
MFSRASIRTLIAQPPRALPLFRASAAPRRALASAPPPAPKRSSWRGTLFVTTLLFVVGAGGAYYGLDSIKGENPRGSLQIAP